MNIPTAKQFQANEKFARYKPPAQYEFNNVADKFSSGASPSDSSAAAAA